MATSGTGNKPDTDDTGTAVSLENVRKTYQLGEPVHALDGVSLDISQGSYTAIMGPSGSGKSTLMNLVGCLDTPTEGTVVVDGADVATLDDRERTTLRGTTVGFVFQTFNLMPRLTALENVALPQLFQNVGRGERRERARELLERVGLADRADHLPNELSGGQRQRVALARALVNDPALVLADEPTGNLDTDTEDDILELFAEFHGSGTTMIVVTHERHVAERAERIVHLLDGKLERIEELGSANGAERDDVDGGERECGNSAERDGTVGADDGSSSANASGGASH